MTLDPVLQGRLMMFTFPYSVRTHFPGYVYLWRLSQGSHLNKGEWAAPGGELRWLPWAGECCGLGKPWSLPADGCRSLMEKPLQSSLLVWSVTALPPPDVCPASLRAPVSGTATWKSPARLRGANLCCCCQCGASAEPSPSQMLPELGKWNQIVFQVSFFSLLTKDARSWKHPECFCLFVLKVRVRIQAWRLVLTSLRSWRNAPSPTNWNSRNILGSSLHQTKISVFRQPNEKELYLRFLNTLHNTYRKPSMSQGLQLECFSPWFL